MNEPSLPPLFTGEPSDADPLARAVERARAGCDGGTLVHRVMADRLRAAIVFAPEVPLSQAMAMLPACGLGFQNALGALAPPEVAVHLGWDGAILLNGGQAGRLRAAASTRDPGQVPDWLVIGLDLAVMQTSDAPGARPEVTSLWDEGCGDVDPMLLLEAWARHTLVWINRWSDEGNRPLHADWAALLHGVDEPVERRETAGTFLGTDEHFGMLIRDGDRTRLVPMSDCLEELE